MGKYLNKFKEGGSKFNEKINDKYQEHQRKPIRHNKHLRESEEGYGFAQEDEDFRDDFEEEGSEKEFNDFNEGVGIQQSQKPASFHHYVLENKYHDLERSVRGFKDIKDKKSDKWITIRRKNHCFTDEEAEGLVRYAQTHLSTDIKLSRRTAEQFSKIMLVIEQELRSHLRRICEYNFGRFGDYKTQGMMKSEAKKIFLELLLRIEANYSMSIEGAENRATHEAVRGQESLQGGREDDNFNRGYS